MKLIEQTRTILTAPPADTRPVHIYDIEIRAYFEDTPGTTNSRGPVATMDGPEECALRMFAGFNAVPAEKGLGPWDEYELIRAEHVVTYSSTIARPGAVLEITHPAGAAEGKAA